MSKMAANVVARFKGRQFLTLETEAKEQWI